MSKSSKMAKNRGEEYGDFRAQFCMAQALKSLLVFGVGEEKRTPLPFAHKEALDMICTKISRIVCGNHDSVDSWRDIAGYATLIADQLEKDKESL